MALKPVVFVSTSQDPFANLAAEDWLFTHREPDQAILFFYRNAPVVMLGRNQNPWLECDVAALPALGVGLARRKSGGGAVCHDLGNLNFSFLLPRTAVGLDTVPALVAKALEPLGIRPYVTPRRGLEVDGRKISGTAFWLTARQLLYHGTLLVASDLQRMARCLYVRTPGLTTHAVTSAPSPVVNLGELLPGLTLDDARRAVTNALAAICTVPTPAPLPFPSPAALADPELAAASAAHASWEWRFARTPPFTLTLGPGPAPALQQAALSVHEGRIVDCRFSPSLVSPGLVPALCRALCATPFAVDTLPRAIAALVRTQPDHAAELEQVVKWFAAGLRGVPAPCGVPRQA